MFKKIYIEISNVCNFNCPFCCKSERAKRFMTIDEFKEITERIKSHTKHIYLHVLGEPLLHPYLDDILRIAEAKGLAVNLTTNGSLIAQQHETLNRNNIRQINISLHDWEENLHCSEEKLRAIIGITKELSAHTYICFRLWNLQNDTAEFNKKCLSILQKELHLEGRISEEKTSGNGITLAPNIFLQNDRRFIWPDFENGIHETHKKCYALRDHIAILSDGTVVPCCLDANANLALGNIFKQSIEEIMQTEKAVRMLDGFRKHQATEAFCQTCGFGSL
ncbi:MAG: SPASM domain-containing protein [Paludibacteraceae bacterium]|nr:SPASM domain-containing protein [Paludibacteraceae bacterium]